MRKKNKISNPIFAGIDTSFLPIYYIKNGKKFKTKNNELIQDFEDFKRCGELENVCNCKNKNECGYIEIYKEIEKI